METSKNPSVLVIGSGPVGLIAANLLAARNINVRIVTKELSPRPVEQSRAEGNHARTLALYERLDVLQDAYAQGRPQHGAVFHRGDKRLGTVGMDDPHSYYPGLLLGQARVERFLEARLLRAGVVVERGWEMTALSQVEDKASAILQNVSSGEIRVIDAPYIVACDGGKGNARTLLGATFEGETDTVQYALADVLISSAEVSYDDDMHVWLSPMMMLARLEGDYWRAVAPTSPEKPLPDTPESVVSTIQDHFDKNEVGIKIHSPRWTSMFRVNTRRVNRMRWKRIFLAGDAAHVHSPMGGQGMNEGMQDALNLVWKLAEVLQYGDNETLLDTYDSERQPMIENLLKETHEMTKFVEVPEKPLAVLRDLALIAGTHVEALHPLFRKQFTGATRNLRESSIVSDSDEADFPGGAVEAGDRAPDAQGLLDSDSAMPCRLFSLWKASHRHELLIFVGESETGEQRQALSEIARAFEDSYGVSRIRARVVTRSGPRGSNFLLDSLSDLHNRFGVKNECLYLVRPDGFVAFRSAALRAEALADFLQEKYGWRKL